MTGDPLEPKAVKEDTGLAFRYLQEDLLAIRGYIKKNQLTTGSVIKSLSRKKAPAIWSLNDPKPAFNYFGIVVGKVFRKLFR